MAEAQNGSNGQNGLNGKDGLKSDPTELTTDQIMREIQHLRELMEGSIEQVSLHVDAADAQMDERFALQITDIRRQVEAKFAEQDRAVQAALAASDKAVTALETATTQRMGSLQELNENKFITYRTLLDSNAEKVALALTAADKAVSAAFASSKEAISKAEVFNEKRFDILTKAIDELKSNQVTAGQIDGMSKQIDDLKLYQASTVGKGQGSTAMWGYVVAGVFLIIAIVSFVNGHYGG